MKQMLKRKKGRIRYDVQLAIGNRLSAKSKYSLRDIAVCIVDKYSITEDELTTIVTMKIGESFRNEDMKITRLP